MFELYKKRYTIYKHIGNGDIHDDRERLTEKQTVKENE